jgi:hypothetical protein
MNIQGPFQILRLVRTHARSVALTAAKLHFTRVFSFASHWLQQQTEPVSVNLLRSPGIDSQPGGPVQQLYLS